MVEIDYFNESNNKFYIRTVDKNLIYSYYSYDMFKSEDNEEIKKFKGELNISIIIMKNEIRNYKLINFIKDKRTIQSFGYFEPPVQINYIDIKYTIYTFVQGEKILKKYESYVFTKEKLEQIIEIRELNQYCGQTIYINKIIGKKIDNDKVNFLKDEKTITLNDLSLDISD